MGRRPWKRRAMSVVAASTLALLTFGCLTPSLASAADRSTIVASPSSAPVGSTIAITGTVFEWSPRCEIVLNNVRVQTSSCTVTKDTLVGSLTIPDYAAAGSYVVMACSPTCASRRPSALTAVAALTVTVPPAPVLVAVPSLVGLPLAAAESALHSLQLLAGYPAVPPNAYVASQQIAAGTLVQLQTRIPLTLVSWVQVPDLTKLTLAQAIATAGPSLVVQSKTHKGRVKTQSPAAGGIVAPTTVIAVTLVYSRNYVPIVVAGSATIVVLVALLAAARAFMQRRRRLARRWYYDHVRLASRPACEVGFDDSASDGIHLPPVRLAVRDTRLQACQLEEAGTR